MITLKNVDVERFEVIYDSKSYGVVDPGHIRKFPRFLAEHAVKHLVDQIMNRADLRLDNITKRQEYAQQIIVGEEAYALPSAVTETERLQAEVERMNKGSDLDAILSKRRAGEETVNSDTMPVEQAALVEPVSTLSQPEVPVSIPEPVQIPTEQPAATVVSEPSTEGEPSREQLYDHARNVMKIDVEDQKTKEAFDAMDIPTLKDAVQYGQ